MPSYRNRRDELVEVSDSHIETAIEIKKELQKMSPSGKCSWATHRSMMEEEGFYNSSTNENYRQMIKQQQKKRGELPAATTYAEMVTDNKLISVKNALGELFVAKRANQNVNRELNKTKREIADAMLFYEELEESLKNKDFSNPDYSFTPFYNKEKQQKHMIACLSDIHYGSKVDIEGRTYSVEQAEELVMDYADKLIDAGRVNNVKEIYIINLGDIVENVYMRTQNTYGSEKNLQEQITDVSDLLIRFIKKISKYFKVKYAGINGNHDRFAQKHEYLYGDGAVSVSNKIIETFIKYSDNENISYIQAEPYHHKIKIKDKNFLFVHGDITPLRKPEILAEQSALHGVQFDAIVGGHIHHYTVKEVAEDRYIATFGSVKGTDEYTLKTLRVSASRSQGIILVDEDGDFEIKKIKL